jgi:hypothetical protein
MDAGAEVSWHKPIRIFGWKVAYPSAHDRFIDLQAVPVLRVLYVRRRNPLRHQPGYFAKNGARSKVVSPKRLARIVQATSKRDGIDREEQILRILELAERIKEMGR